MELGFVTAISISRSIIIALQIFKRLVDDPISSVARRKIAQTLQAIYSTPN